MKYFSLLALLLCVLGAGCLSGKNDVSVDETTTVDTETAPEAQIVLDYPGENDEVTSPLILAGRARTFEATVNWRLKKMNGGVVEEGFFTMNDTDDEYWGTIDERIFLPVLNDEEYILEVFEYSAKDGSVINLVTRHIRIKDEGKTTVMVYFVDPAMVEAGDCSQVDFEKRTVAHTVNVAELALQELINGPTSDWAETQLPPYTRINSIVVKGGVATVDFWSSNEAAWNGGSCHVLALRAQIEETLKQFDSVDSVVIKVNGHTDGILEP
ncbi:MAG: Gmad2 immunoglobulin-like domain-containing protein [Patescibacteria group bacterium]|nr:GerMN domain-containing protein [Patescibacteria group bacterium]